MWINLVRDLRRIESAGDEQADESISNSNATNWCKLRNIIKMIKNVMRGGGREEGEEGG